MRRNKGEGAIGFNEKKGIWVGRYTEYNNENNPIRKSYMVKLKKRYKATSLK